MYCSFPRWGKVGMGARQEQVRPHHLERASAVAGFGGRRFLVPQHEEAAKDCRCAGSCANQVVTMRQPSNSPVISRRTTLGTLALASAVWLSNARAQPTAQAPWPEVAANLPDAVFSGSARLRFWGFEVYDAQLWVEPGFRASRLGAHALALSLTYLRSLRGPAIAERSITEMRRQGPLDDAQASRWQQAMARMFPDVRDGDRLTGLWHPGQGARFWFNGTARGQIDDDVFAARFFGIWLGDATSEPAMRQALLAGAAP